MTNRSINISSYLFLLVTITTTTIYFLLLHTTNATCPNSCTGHGNCGYSDICHCYRGWQAGDCSQRTCAYGYAFTTTPQGDLNMDGDREDNSFKQLSEPGVIYINTNTITFARSGLQINELQIGDGIRICNENFIVTQLRGRTITGNDDYLDKDEYDDTTHVINSNTEYNYKRRIKEIVVDSRHTQQCGRKHYDNYNEEWTGGISNVTNDFTFTKISGIDFNSFSNVQIGSRMYIFCNAISKMFKAEEKHVDSLNRYGYLKDDVYMDGGQFLTIKQVINETTMVFEEKIDDLVDGNVSIYIYIYPTTATTKFSSF